MNLPEYVDLKIRIALAQQEVEFIERENNAIMADGAALEVERRSLDPTSVRYQAIELALEQVERRTQSLKEWGADATERVSRLNDKPPEPPASA